MIAIHKVLLVSADRQFVFLYINLKPELTFLMMMLVVLSPYKFRSMLMPKYLIFLWDFIRWPLQFIWKSVMVFNFRFGLKRMHSVLQMCRESFLLISHLIHDSCFLWEYIPALNRKIVAPWSEAKFRWFSTIQCLRH